MSPVKSSHNNRLDPLWMAARIESVGVEGLLADYKDNTADLDLGVIYRALQLAMPALADDPSQLAAQLRGMYTARAEAEEALFAQIAGQLTPEQCATLDELCRTDEHERHERRESLLATLGTPPRVPSAPAIAKECARLESIRAVTPSPLEWGPVTANRRRQWAAVARRNTAQALRSYPPAKRYTLLLAFLVVRGEEVTDAIVEMFDTLIGRVFSHSEDELTEAKLQQAQARLEGARLFRTVAKVLLDPEVPSERVRDEVFRRVPRERVQKAVERDVELEQSDAQAYLTQVHTHFRYIRSFAPHVLETLRFGSTKATAGTGSELLEALEVLATMNAERRVVVPPTAPLGFVPRRWERAAGRPRGRRCGWERGVLGLVMSVPFEFLIASIELPGVICPVYHGKRERAPTHAQVHTQPVPNMCSRLGQHI